MNWIETLYRTYENCVESVGDITEDEPLLPICHTTQNAHIEVTLDSDGRFNRARVLPKAEQRTLIPCTEGSGGRAGAKPTSHPLCDKLQYLAGDFLDFGGRVTSGFLAEPSEPHEIYVRLLTGWCASIHAPAKVKAVLKYVKNGTLTRDLINASVLQVDEEKTLLEKWTDKENPAPAIFGALPPTSAPQDAVIRWAVEIPGELEPRLWQDVDVWASWSKYYVDSLSSTGLCYVLGSESSLAIQHPAKLRHAADKAKLISSNDGSGFTFRGRFTDPNGDQVCGVSFDVTQKAHNALRWLIARQGKGKNYGGQAIVAWAVSGKTVPPILSATDSIFDDEDFLLDENDEQSSGLHHAEVGQDFALRLKHKISGYKTDLGNADKIVVIALDSATPGRMSIIYYRELEESEFLDRLEQWHQECAWFQNFGKDRHFVGAPAPKDIAICAYGRRLDDKLQAATHRRLLPCIIESAPIPRDLVETCIQRASSPQSMDHWEWEKALGIACSLYRKHQIEINQHHHTMSLERERTTRDYLYGRLLAVADQLEGCALRAANEKRDTNAARLMQRFANCPYSTWLTIELSLDPYRRRLQSNSPGLLHLYEKELQEIMGLFTAEDFEKDLKLKGEFLLAYHTQKTALWTKQPKDPASETLVSETV